MNYAMGQMTPLPMAACTAYFRIGDDGEVLAAGGRPPALVEPRPQLGLQQHGALGYELVLALDAQLQMCEFLGWVGGEGRSGRRWRGGGREGVGGQESHVSEGVKFGFVGHAYNQIERLRGGRHVARGRQ